MMQAVIMAAGMGTRLGDVTADIPKALVRVNGKELILHAIDFLDAPAITEKMVVTGFEGKKLEEFIRANRPGVKVLHNPDFRAGNILTLATALPHIAGDVLLMNVDHIYPRRMLEKLLYATGNISAVCDFDRKLSDDDMKVKLEGGALCRIDKKLEDFDCGYIGMTICRKEDIAAYKQAVLDVIGLRGKTACAENVLAHMALNSKRVNICDASGMGWFEVDTVKDLEIAEAGLRSNPDYLK